MISATNFNTAAHNVDTIIHKKKSRIPLIDNYFTYINSDKQQQVFWFLKAIIIIPCLIMVPSIMIMHAAVGNHIPFVGICMILFFLNVVVHIAEVKSKYYIPVYHFSVLIMILVPLIASIIKL